ncbi:MAG TPA: ABC transporter permease [Luteitalea sp.]|nr:ABC transporter permease [Luteitalea sp.]
MHAVWKDLAYAWRRHRRDPALGLMVVATLGLAVGLNASVFAIYTAVALRPWPVPAPDRVVNVYALPDSRPRDAVAIGASLAQVRFLDTEARLLEGLAATRDLSLRLEGGNTNRGTPAQAVTGGFFRVLKVGMARGRGFLPEEEVSASPRAVVVLAHRTWQIVFAGDESIVGRRIRVDDVPFTVVGVAPEDFGGTSDRHASAWVPFAALRVLRPLDKDVVPLLDSPAYCCASVFGRLRPGVSPEQATTELSALVGGYAREHGLAPGGVHLTDTAMLSHPGSWSQAGLVFGLLQGAMLLVLLLACANIGNLLLARGLSRQHEIGMRLSLGASRARLIQQLLIECVPPALIGGLVGLGLANAMPGWLLAQITDSPMNLSLAPGVEGLGFTLLTTIASVVAFGLAPALHSTRTDLLVITRSRASSPRLRLRSVLLAVQVAACVVMLVSAALMIRGIQAVAHRDPGFRVQGLDVLQFEVPAGAYGEEESGALVRTLRAWQDASEARTALTRTHPLSEGRHATSVRLADEPVAADRTVTMQQVDTSYFDVLGVPLVAGRAFTRSDGADAVIVNEAFVRRWLDGQAPVGTALVMAGDSPRRIIGVARDAHLQQLDRVEPIAFEPVSTANVPRLILPSTPGLAASVTAAVQRLDRRIVVRRVSMATIVEDHMKDPRLASRLAAALGLVALILASMGLAGVCGYLVNQRTREIGIRVALGATAWDVMRQVLATVGRSAAWGLASGALAAAVVAWLVVSTLPGVRLVDLSAYGSALVALLVGGLAASWLPARRALRIQPSEALRQE